MPAAPVPTAPPTAAPVQRVEQKDWTCVGGEGKDIGAVNIWWGYTPEDAAWACNRWNADCGGQCTAKPALAPVPTAPPTAAPVQRVEQKDWTCVGGDGKDIGAMNIWWGYAPEDAAWACNQWNADCGGQCTAKPAAAPGPGGYFPADGMPSPSPKRDKDNKDKKDKDKKDKGKKDKEPKQERREKDSASVSSSSGAPKIGGESPPRIPDHALRVLGVDQEQASTILAMIGGPEQSNVQWWKTVDGESVFGYCENIDDDRGVTIGIAGFVTRYGEPQRMIQEYGAGDVGNPKDCKPKSSKCSLCDWVRARGNDQRWIDIQMNHYADGYWKLVPKYIPEKFKDNALIKGLLLDTAMNAGEFKEGNAWGVKEVSQATRGDTPLEWVKNFCDIRFDHFTANSNKKAAEGRLLTWRTLAKDGKWDMRGVDPCKYAFCYGSKLGAGCKGCGGK